MHLLQTKKPGLAPVSPFPGLLRFFDTLFGDPCSALVVALVAQCLASQLLSMLESATAERNRRRGTLAGVGVFFVLVYAEYRRQGADWLPILAMAGLRAWIVAALLQVLLALLSQLTAGVLSPLLFRWANERQRRAHAKYQAQLAAQQQQATVPASVPAVAPVPPPPTFESEIVALLARFETLREAILKLPIPADEQEARIKFLKEKLDEQINQLMERYCT